MKYIRRGEEGVRASDLGPSENQATERREMSWLNIQATSFSEYFEQFPELYGKVNSIVYGGFTLLCILH